MAHMSNLPRTLGIKALTKLYRSIPRAIKRRSSGRGVKAKRKTVMGP